MRNFDWRALVERYARGRTICNCGEAYYFSDEKGNDFCKGGCQANIHFAKAELATAICEDLAKLTPPSSEAV